VQYTPEFVLQKLIEAIDAVGEDYVEEEWPDLMDVYRMAQNAIEIVEEN